MKTFQIAAAAGTENIANDNVLLRDEMEVDKLKSLFASYITLKNK